ncbi:MAG: hypothetical protein ACJAUA_000246 [Zhongshania aliphaticivorans]|jgi:hypothetical protein
MVTISKDVIFLQEKVAQHRPGAHLRRISGRVRTFVRSRDAPASGLELVETALPPRAVLQGALL